MCVGLSPYFLFTFYIDINLGKNSINIYIDKISIIVYIAFYELDTILHFLKYEILCVGLSPYFQFTFYIHIYDWIISIKYSIDNISIFINIVIYELDTIPVFLK